MNRIPPFAEQQAEPARRGGFPVWVLAASVVVIVVTLFITMMR